MRVDPKFYAGYGLDAYTINKLLNSPLEDIVVELMAIQTAKDKQSEQIKELAFLVYEKRISDLENETASLRNEVTLLRDIVETIILKNATSAKK